VNDPAIVVDQVAKRFRVYRERNDTLKSAVMRRRRAAYEEFWALDGVSLEIAEGSTYGLIGDNGSGKSTLLKTMARILRPDRGEIRVTGRLAALLEVGSGFHPEMSGRDNIYLNGSILGMTRAEIDRKFDDIVGFSGVEQFIDQPVKNYSSGMYVRLGFSVAIHVEPEVLLVDEVLSVGDAAFQERCAEKFVDFRREGRTVVVVSHALDSLRAMCDEVAWLSHGKLIETGPASTVLTRYQDDARTDMRESATEDRGPRWGTGEAEITRVELLSDGRPIETVMAGAQLTVRLHVDAHERIERPVFGLAIDTSDGVYLWANNTRDAQFSLAAIEGPTVVECNIPRLALHPGAYSVRASVVDTSTTHVFDYLQTAARISVLHNQFPESSGYVSLDGTWAARDLPLQADGPDRA
jgi:ABC-2 type transport system ATP-binding protein